MYNVKDHCVTSNQIWKVPTNRASNMHTGRRLREARLPGWSCGLAFRLPCRIAPPLLGFGCEGHQFYCQNEEGRFFPNPRIREVSALSPAVAIIAKGMGRRQFPLLLEEWRPLANAANLPKAFDKPAKPVRPCEPFCVAVKGNCDPVDNIISFRSWVHSTITPFPQRRPGEVS